MGFFNLAKIPKVVAYEKQSVEHMAWPDLPKVKECTLTF